MNYRHIYHAGNFADVFKHLILSRLLLKLSQKETPFGVLDTHAGIGMYDFYQEEAQKTGEYQRGIAALLACEALRHHPLCKSYVDVIAAINGGEAKDALRYYPGSPLIIQHMLRTQDHLTAIELHPEDYQQLKMLFKKSNQVAVHHMDAYQALKAFLPLKEKRGLVLIDPPFEQKEEFAQMARGLMLATKRFSNGIYALWYPIKERREVQFFHNNLIANGLKKMLLAEIIIAKEAASKPLIGCGMVIINAPWKLDEELKDILPLLAKTCGQDAAASEVRWLQE